MSDFIHNKNVNRTALSLLSVLIAEVAVNSLDIKVHFSQNFFYLMISLGLLFTVIAIGIIPFKSLVQTIRNKTDYYTGRSIVAIVVAIIALILLGGIALKYHQRNTLPLILFLIIPTIILWITGLYSLVFKHYSHY